MSALFEYLKKPSLDQIIPINLLAHTVVLCVVPSTITVYDKINWLQLLEMIIVT